MMTPRTTRRAASLLALSAAITGLTLAQSFGPPAYDLSWHSLDGSGGTSANGSIQLFAILGQPEGPVAMTAGQYSLTGGFVPGAVPPANDCPADIVTSGASANVVNIDDLLAVISAWGACPLPCPPRCAADIAPIGGGAGQCAVNIDDLLGVISAWGACP